MDRCPICKREFPDCTESECHLDLVVKAFIDGEYVKMCPLCYAVEHKRIHGLEWHPKGKLACQMFEETKKLYPYVLEIPPRP